MVELIEYMRYLTSIAKSNVKNFNDDKTEAIIGLLYIFEKTRNKLQDDIESFAPMANYDDELAIKQDYAQEILDAMKGRDE